METEKMNQLLQNFITGGGPENYIFPVNGVISKTFENSRIVKKALERYAKTDAREVFRQSFGIGDLFGNIKDNAS
ncbi:hypothetical protein [Flagellimonas sp. CMM7]|uniref:hypothetical protein n=1 Tax=Flagellimonas sp. CMM7 TaxID=2654676 RepID=UPI0013D659F3|nr:hypothetical protein [Flagellimonas sp. CMM7]UII80116.1 hypothetical protein LV704_01010 [Flagellimonas sp. CMM7]